MSLSVFLSYSRADEALAVSVAKDLTDAGVNVWRDERLSGGQSWWDAILTAVRDADAVVFVLSARSLNSEPCARERAYAEALGKAVLPVRIDRTPPSIAPPSLASKEWIDYQPDDRTGVVRLLRGVYSLPPAPALPDPLPPPPAVPLSYVNDLAALVHRTQDLTATEQHSLLFELRQGLRDPEERAQCVQLLERLRLRRDLLASVARDIDEVLTTTSGPGGPATSDAAAPRAAAPAASETSTTSTAPVPPAARPVPAAPARPASFGGPPPPPGGVAVAPAPAGSWVSAPPGAPGAGPATARPWTVGPPGPPGPPPQGPPGQNGPYGPGRDAPRRRRWLPWVIGGVAGLAVVVVLLVVAALSYVPYDYGDDARLDAMWDACDAGELASCDELLAASGEGTDYEEFGLTCGQRVDPTEVECATLPFPYTYGDDADLDALYEQCAGGDMAACDTLWLDSPFGSEYEAAGSSCGYTTDPRMGECATG